MLLCTQWAPLASVGFSTDRSVHLELNAICLQIIDHRCPTCCPGESLDKTRRNHKVSDICVNHTKCAFSDQPFIMQYACNTVCILFHIWKQINYCVLSAVYPFLPKLTQNRRKRQLCFSSYGFLKHFFAILLGSQRMSHGYVAYYVITAVYLC